MKPSTLEVVERDRRPQSEATSANDGLVWQGAEYPCISPGRYQVRGAKIHGPQWVRRYRRWSLRIEFDLVNEPGNVSMFFNLGTDPEHPKPPGRHSKYWRAWTLANGEPPHRGEKMTPDRFLEGQFFYVMVGYVKQRDDGQVKDQAELYSVVTEILSVEWP